MIKVNGYTAGITVSGGSSPTPTVSREIELVENNTTSGSSTFTITEDGTYLIIASNSYQGSRSITLPQGRTATIDEDIETTYGMTVIVVDLQANDVVTMSATPSTWAAFSKQIYKLTNISVSSVDDTEAKNDGSQTFSVSASGDYLVVGLCFGRLDANYRDDTSETKSSNNINNKVGVNTITRVFADNGANIPELNLYGYDGGGDFFISMNIN